MKKKKGYQYQCDPSRQQKVHAPNTVTFHLLKHRTESNTSPLTTSKQNKTKLTKTEPILIPNGRNRQQTNEVTDRQRHSLLAGADLYVARFGSQNTKPGKQNPCCDNAPDPLNDGLLSGTPKSPPSSITSQRSLHDELLNPHPRPTIPIPSPPSDPHPFDWSTVHASRPCYRCVSYMHSVGIKRVFWSTDEGKWEGAKVRDLVDALDSSTSSLGDGGGEDGGKRLLDSGVFITKHEVLKMRRVMGGA